MKTSEALYEAIEAVSRLEVAMFEDGIDSETTRKGIVWLDTHWQPVEKAYKLLKGVRESLNEEEVPER